MAAPDGSAPSSWKDWKRPVDNNAPPAYKKMRLEFTAAEEEPLPPGVDPREDVVYTLTHDNITKSRELDKLTSNLTKEYNNIAYNRRDIIRRLARVRKGKGKNFPHDILTDIKDLVAVTEAVRKHYKEIKRKGGKPLPFPEVFKVPVGAQLK